MKHSIDENMLGICHDGKPGGEFSYMIGVVSTSNDADYEKLTISKATWAVFESKGPLPDAIQKVWKEIFEEFLPGSGYQHAPMPDFELYPNMDASQEDYVCEVWIPVIKK